MMKEEVALIAKVHPRPLAISEAILATAIWASSFVIVKIVLPHMGPLTIAALRYFLAFLLLGKTLLLDLSEPTSLPRAYPLSPLL